MAAREPGSGPSGASCRSALLSPSILLAAGFVLLLACFADKPAHIDDPLFLWAARHALADFWRPYDLALNWYGAPQPLYEVMQNPPLVSYLLAGVMRWLGPEEPALHLAFLVFPALLALGVWRLAARFCSRPTLAAVLALAPPAVLVSATSLMSDIPMLVCWVWGVLAWVRGCDRQSAAWHAASGLLLAGGVLCKYYALAAAPLLLAYSLARDRRVRPHLAFLVLPLAALAGYEALSLRLYGVGAVTQAMGYSLDSGLTVSLASRAALATMFLAGTLAPAAALLPLFWRGAAAARWAAAGLAVALAYWATAWLLGNPDAGVFPGWVRLQGAVFLAGGAHLLVLAAARAWRERTPDDLLLALAVLGPWAFAAGVNWCVNARAVLPAAPFLGILLARLLDRPDPAGPGPFARRAALAVILALSLAAGLVVTRADALWAASARQAARELAQRIPPQDRARVRFLGHWGFQYFMEEEGFVPLAFRNSRLEVGDLLIVPVNNLDRALPWNLFDRTERLDIPASPVAALRTGLGFAGFYSSACGPLPYVLGPMPAETYHILRARAPLAFP